LRADLAHWQKVAAFVASHGPSGEHELVLMRVRQAEKLLHERLSEGAPPPSPNQGHPWKQGIGFIFRDSD
jgi:hypothetical protein